jgi:predicted secreted protein
MPEEISARDFGRLESEVTSLRDLVRAQTMAMQAMTARIEAINVTLSEAKGGWRTLMYVGGAAGSIGAGISWIISHIKFGPL